MDLLNRALIASLLRGWVEWIFWKVVREVNWGFTELCWLFWLIAYCIASSISLDIKITDKVHLNIGWRKHDKCYFNSISGIWPSSVLAFKRVHHGTDASFILSDYFLQFKLVLLWRRHCDEFFFIQNDNGLILIFQRTCKGYFGGSFPFPLYTNKYTGI